MDLNINIEAVQNLMDDRAPINLSYSDDDIDDAKDWSEDSNIIIILPKDTIDELEDEWTNWQRMTKRQQDLSDEKSLQIFGITNYEHYVGLKSKLYGNKFDDDYSDDIYITTEDTKLKFLNKEKDDNKEVCSIKDSLKRELAAEEPNLLSISSLLISLNNKGYGDNNITNESLNYLNNKRKSNILINTFPFFDYEEVNELGIYNIDKNKNYYKETADNKFLDDNKIPTKRWIEEYVLISKGIVSENTESYTRLWIDKLNELYMDYNYIKENGTESQINSRKQSILELGWNPEINFSIENRIKASSRMRNIIESKYNMFSIEDISFLSENKFSDNIIQEADNTTDTLYPVYIVLSYTYTTIGKIITKITNSIYSHASITLDYSLNRLYSFNMSNKGFSLENIKDYLKQNDNSRIVVYCIFLKKKDLTNLKLKLDQFLANIEYTSYSIANLFSVLLNKPLQRANSMICSQFVDFILKSINVNITNKVSSLVTPKDFTKINNKKVYKVYEGLIKDYNENKVSSVIRRLMKKAKYINESVIYEQFINKYKVINTSKEVIDNYKSQYSALKHVRTNSENKGIILVDNKKFVAILQWDINSKYIIALEVAPEYRKQGIAKQLLNYAISKDIKLLSVNKKNTNAINLYKSMNYKVKSQDKSMLYMYHEQLECIGEAKEFPVSFDKDGNLFIKKSKKDIDFEHEYAESHKLLKLYGEKINREGLAYELTKLWFMNTILEKKIYNEKSTKEELAKYHKARAKILNDFQKYLKILMEHEKDFNFTNYYNNSPFSDVSIKISNSTLKYSGQALKNIVQLLIK